MKETIDNLDQVSKKKHYQQLIVLQAIMILLIMIAFQALNEIGIKDINNILTPIFGIMGILLSYVMWSMIRQFTKNPFIIISSLICLFSRFAIAIFINSNLLESLSEVQKDRLVILSILLSIYGMSVMMLFMIQDIFNEEHEITYRLWGAGCIYILIGPLFGNVYNLVEILQPGSIGITGADMSSKLMHSMTHSMYIISSLDSKYEHVSGLIRNISVIESIFINLYIVLLVGRLLSK